MVDETNRYRYYSYRQLEVANIITVLREIGMSLNEIKSYLSQRSPQRLEATLNKQRERLESQIFKLKEIQDIIDMRLNVTRDSFKISAGHILLETYMEEKLFFGPQLPQSDDLAEVGNYLPDFYATCLKENISYGFPLGTLVLQETIQSENRNKPAFFYYRLPRNSYPTNYVKPQGTYLVGYANTDYGYTDTLYKKLTTHMESYLLRIAIQVKRAV